MTTSPSGPPRGLVLPPSLVRDPDDRVVAGVCAAFARATGTDPVLWRVGIAVLALFGGAGVALYLLGWVLIPRLGSERSPAERLLRGTDGRLRPFGIVLLVLAGALLLAALDNGPAVAALLVLGAIGFLVWQDRPATGGAGARTMAGTPPGAQPEAPAYAPWGAPSSVGWGPGPEAPGGPSGPGEPGDPGAPGPVPMAPRPVPPRSALGPLTLGAAALAAGAVWLLGVAGVDGIGAVEVLATGLLVVGAGLVVGAWWGRARWLAAPAVVLALALGVAAAAEGTDGAGDRTWLAADGGSYALTFGEAVLDLRALEPGEAVQARVGLGSLTVLVPADLPVAVEASVGLGELDRVALDGTRSSLLGDDPVDRRVEFLVGDDAGEPVRLDLAVRVGEIEVRRVPS